MTFLVDRRRPVRGRAPNRNRPPTVALVGADGAGKSTVSRLLEEAALPWPVKRVYMGVNLEASTLMLPTTRLLLAVKRARGGRPDMAPGSDPASGGPRSTRQLLRETARFTVWTLEEWLRQLVAAWYRARGFLVVFDRHFLADHYFTDVTAGRTSVRRAHGWMLQHLYPKPGLVICLDAPADVLYARKSEASQAWLDRRRRQYLRLSQAVPAFAVVDAGRSLETVVADVVAEIHARTSEVRR